MATGEMSAVIQHLRRVAILCDGAGLTDGQLLADFINSGDETALAALVHRHAPMVWNVCRRVLCNHHDAEDAFQATFLVFVRKAHSITGRELLASWLYGVARLTAMKSKAKSARNEQRERQVVTMPEAAAAEQDHSNDLKSLLDQELGLLPDRYRAVIVLCDLEGKTRKEAARELGVPEGTLNSRLARARTMLAKRLARHGMAFSTGLIVQALTTNPASAGVPAALVTSTIKAATTIAAGNAAAASLVSAEVAALAEGVMRIMFVTRLKFGAGVVLSAFAMFAIASTMNLSAQTESGKTAPAVRATISDSSKPAGFPGQVAESGKKQPEKAREPIWPGWFFDKRVQAELNFTEEQKKQLAAVVNKVSKKYEAELKEVAEKEKKGAAAPGFPISRRWQELAQKRHREQVKALAEEAPKILSERAITRLYQIQRQERGLDRLIQDTTIQKTLKLDDAQVKKIEDVLKKAAPTAQREIQKLLNPVGPLAVEAMAAARNKAYAEAMKEVRAVLTAAQRRVWDDLVGEPFAFKK
jgi:RNA polymerase sigma factor (sigma-70 family)